MSLISYMVRLLIIFLFILKTFALCDSIFQLQKIFISLRHLGMSRCAPCCGFMLHCAFQHFLLFRLAFIVHRIFQFLTAGVELVICAATDLPVKQNIHFVVLFWCVDNQNCSMYVTSTF